MLGAPWLGLGFKHPTAGPEQQVSQSLPTNMAPLDAPPPGTSLTGPRASRDPCHVHLQIALADGGPSSAAVAAPSLPQ